MGGELRIHIADERTPPQIEGLEADGEQWALSLEVHRELLIDIAGVEPTGELTLRELETIRARLEGYVEREKRASTGTGESTARGAQRRGPASLRRLLGRLLDAVPFVGTSSRSSERAAGSRRSYSVSRVQRLAEVFRIAIDARRGEIPSASVDPLTDASARTGSSADAAAD